MLFRDVIGQQAAKQGLLRMWQHNKLPHAIMIAGAEGTGSLPMAVALAQYIFCENKSGADSCGVCPACSKASKLAHPDLHLSFPSVKPKSPSEAKARSKIYIQEFREFFKQTPYGTTFEWLQFIGAENRQGNLSAEECNDILESLNLKSFEGGYKVLIMWRPEYIGKEGNKLLKMIEEPPKDTIIIFAAENPEDILATIRSRTQSVRLIPLSIQELTSALTERWQLPEAKAGQLALVSGGSYTEALRVMNSTENDLFQEVRKLFLALFVDKGNELAKLTDEWADTGREHLKNLIAYVINLLEYGVRSQFIPVYLPPDEAKFTQNLRNKQIPIESLKMMVDTITETGFFIERNAHVKTQLLAMMIRLHYIVRLKPLPI